MDNESIRIKADERVQELLKPRYKVIADYPGSIFTIGEIIYPAMDGDKWAFIPRGVRKLTDFPHLFKPLAWWEERLPEEMPLYVKYKKKIIKPDKWVIVGDSIRFHIDTPFLTDSAYSCEPATEKEYNDYINKHK